jgi:hypothetical protein
VPAGSELSDGLGRPERAFGEHAAALVLNELRKNGGAERTEGSHWALPSRGANLVGDADGAVELARRNQA